MRTREKTAICRPRRGASGGTALLTLGFRPPGLCSSHPAWYLLWWPELTGTGTTRGRAVPHYRRGPCGSERGGTQLWPTPPWHANPTPRALHLSCPERNPEGEAGSMKLRWAVPPGDCPALGSLLSPTLSKWSLSQREVPIYAGGRRALRRGCAGFSQRPGSRKKTLRTVSSGSCDDSENQSSGSFTGINPEDVYPENSRPDQA